MSSTQPTAEAATDPKDNPTANTTPAPPKSSLMASLVPSIISRSLLAPLRLAPPSHSAVLLELSPSVISWPASKPRYATSGIQPSSLPSIVSSCPSLSGPDARFAPSPLLPTGHAQTIYSTFFDTVESERVFYARKAILLPDGGIITLDVSDPEIMRKGAERKERGEEQSAEVEWDLRDDGRRTVVILHGLTGGSHESYARHVVRDFSAPQEDGGKGWRSIVVNFRGCANTPITSPQLYSAAKTSDVRAALLYIRHALPSSPLTGIGFSLGANVLAKYLGEEGDDAQMWGAVIYAAPYDCLAGSKCLESGGVMPTVYSKAMSRNLCRVARTHKDTLALYPPFRPLLDTLLGSGPAPAPGEPSKTIAQLAKERGTRPGTLKWCDDLLVRHVGGHSAPFDVFPYEDADAYYAAAGAIVAIDGLRRPILSLNSDDDPIVAPAAVTELRVAAGLVKENGDEEKETEGNPYIVLATTRGGGHLGLWESRRQRWLHKPAVQFLQALFDEADRSSAGGQAKAAPVPSPLDKEAGATTFEIEVELLPSEALPVYRVRGDKDGSPSNSGNVTPSSKGNSTSSQKENSTATDEDDEEAISRAMAAASDLEGSLERSQDPPKGKADSSEAISQSRIVSEALRGGATPKDELGATKGLGARMPWLRTHVLKEAPLVHPRMAVEGWEDVEGEIIRLEMTQNKARREVGFAELPAWTRVAGVGDLWQGGLETPGAAHLFGSKTDDGSFGNAKGSKPGTAKGMVAGL